VEFWEKKSGVGVKPRLGLLKSYRWLFSMFLKSHVAKFYPNTESTLADGLTQASDLTP
jgi:hypothetical protein